MLSVAIRIAQRMGIHNESTYVKCSPLESEMRRRLWWSLVIFDNRISEMSDYKTTTLTPTWDCRTPLNVNDFDILAEMKNPPAVQEKASEAIFAVVRSELGDFVRHSSFHLDFTNPSLKSIAKETRHSCGPEGGELMALERTMEEKYLEFCNPEIPLHYMTIWTTRGYLAKAHLVDHYSRYSRTSISQTDSQRDNAMSHALNMLECDTKLMNSPLAKGYIWLINSYFPFTAYIHIVQDLKRRPVEKHAENTWEVMSDNYEARFSNLEQDHNALCNLFSKIILQAWEAREAVLRQSDKLVDPPRIVQYIKRETAKLTSNAQNIKMQQPNNSMGISMDDFTMPMPMEFGEHNLLPYGMGVHGGFSDTPGQVATEFDVNQLDWTMMEWNPMRI